MIRHALACLTLAACLADAAAQTICHGEPGLRSLSSDRPVKLRLTNAAREPLSVYWVNFQGRRQFYATIPPGQSYTQSTFSGHPWVLATPAGACRALLVPNGGDLELTVLEQAS